MRVEANQYAPQRVVIFIEAKIHELMDTGECSGNVSHRVERFPVSFPALNLLDAQRQLNELLEGVKTQCKTMS